MRVRTLLLTGLGAVYLAFLGVFAYVAARADHFPGDLSATLWVQAWRAPWLDTVMIAISAPGFRPLGLPLVCLTAAGLYLWGRRRESGLMLTAFLGAFAVTHVVGHAVARPRPVGELVQTLRDMDGVSFPSGHVIHYVVFIGTLTLIVTHNMRSGAARWLCWACYVLALVAIGLSRMYFGAHWLSDVVGGYAFGALVMAGVIGLWRLWVCGGEEADSGAESTESGEADSGGGTATRRPAEGIHS